MTMNNGLPPVNEALGLPDPRQPWDVQGLPTQFGSAYMGLHALQGYHKTWTDHNFPGQEPVYALLGVGEELGELHHAHLKARQGIRGTAEEHLAETRDAIGDIMVYLMHYANDVGVDLDECIRGALAEVWPRDWQKYPGKGRPEEEKQWERDGKTYTRVSEPGSADTRQDLCFKRTSMKDGLTRAFVDETLEYWIVG